MPAGSKRDPPLASVELMSNGGSFSGITEVKKEGEEVLQVPEQRFLCSPCFNIYKIWLRKMQKLMFGVFSSEKRETTIELEVRFLTFEAQPVPGTVIPQLLCSE
ncbi:hypothetical protein BTVI_69524 [Pitangus sulphuratus]|nr:hypothetical protein BTVI_69524 [Pitangus sulphuratus]